MPDDGATRTTPAPGDEGAGGLGVFVGGRSSRMGGQPKGLLRAPGSDETLVGRALRVGASAGFGTRWLVGDLDVYDALADATAERGERPGFCGRLRDAPAGVGPLGGLRALLQAAVAADQPLVVAVACDMPHVDTALLRALREYRDDAPIVAARRGPDAPWEPLLARYRPATVLPALDAALAAGERSFQALFRRIRVCEFVAPGLGRALDDWDRPEDVRRDAGDPGER